MKICYPVKEVLVNNIGIDRWKYLERYGEISKYGEIYLACLEKNCDYVLKYIPYQKFIGRESVVNEINLQIECSKLNLSPKILDAWTCETGGAFVMEKLDYTIEVLFSIYKTDVVRNIILTNIISQVDKLHINGFYNGDLHFNNIMVKQNGKYMNDENEEIKYKLANYSYFFIDFGFGGKIKDKFDSRSDYNAIYQSLYDFWERHPNDIGMDRLIKIFEIHMAKFV